MDTSASEQTPSTRQASSGLAGLVGLLLIMIFVTRSTVIDWPLQVK